MPSEKSHGFREKISFIHGNVLVVAVTIGFWSFGMRMTQSYASLYILALGATPFILGIISATSTFVLAFMRIPGGYIADRWGRKKVIYILTFFVALTYFIYAFAVDWKWILVAAILSSLSLLYQPALQAIIA
ncbi:MAG: MFS transporter, partial [Candidatus Baldrarchaeota archaeon]